MSYQKLRASGLVRCSAAVIMLWLAGGAAQASDPEYLVEYRAYNDALERGDATAAQEHAAAAWRAAEEARGDDKLTAILAFNFAHQALFSARSEAIVAIRRANELRELAAGSLPARTLDLFLAYLELAAGKNNRRNATALREALNAIGDEGADVAFELAAISLALAVSDYSAERLREAAASAAVAEAAIQEADPGDIDSLALAGIIRGAATMLHGPRRESRIREAQTEFRKVRDLYPLQQDIESFDSGLAQALAWDFAANALLESIGVRAEQDWDGRRSFFEETAEAECGSIEWASRSAPDYPRQAVRKGYVGAVLVGYHIGEDLGIAGARVLAEVPADQFGAAVLKAVTSWKVASMDNDARECRRNKLTRVRFLIDV